MRCYEWMGYDEEAQPITTTFADYLLPGATEVPHIEVRFVEFPSPLNPLGVKGVGEFGLRAGRRRDHLGDRERARAVRRADRGISGDAGAAVCVAASTGKTG